MKKTSLKMKYQTKKKSTEIKKHKSKLRMKCQTKACGCKTGNNIYKKSQQQKFIKVFAVSHSTRCA